jgi:acyl-lipid omega-3 desaturase
MVGLLAGLTFLMGPVAMLKLYGVPYFVRATFLLFSPNFCQKII